MSHAAAGTRTASFNKLRGSDVPPERARGTRGHKKRGPHKSGCSRMSVLQPASAVPCDPFRPSAHRQPASQRQLQRQPRTAANVEVYVRLATYHHSLFGLM